ncbi:MULTISPECIES: IS1096 element passenger TnpR family protein [Flavobacterium]|uniref:Plasmid pRiA4b Orf3-like domain-containing protein n=2 Tax=Flavobacterium TaxID=237 RepID=A0AA94EZ91_9FLAO|nr:MULTISPECIES: hypothetical protein [Flavobacterium]OXA79421.1 hypothetical protein B0A56_07725 [Flavobacterium columnare NBRC 100251 = ATCC 23463]AMA48886.1 hypothetical protein AWN65_05110 [Flavobacterium covae]AND64982.1 hypothetical protein AX766_11605 [Flavobacterium covae]MCH4830851.1 hypothetical protein [Flavobacterium columnare]MCH4833209.1 hypothetical protein [Flavobacterium columnare]
MIYKYRVILDAEEDVFRDIAIEENNSLEDLHNAIVNAFGFDGMEMAAFYTCDDQWNQDQEIPLFDTSDNPGEGLTMADHILSSTFDKNNTKIIYVYDFLNMWTFFVELASIEEPEQGMSYPDLLFSHGVLPLMAPDKEFDAEKDDFYEDFQDDYDDEDFDMFDGDDSFSDFGFEENWN